MVCWEDHSNFSSPSDTNSNMTQHTYFPLSKHQRAIWLEALLYPNQPIFNIGTYVLLDGIPDAKHLERAIQRTIKQHNALRLQIVKNGADPAALFRETTPFQLHVRTFENRHQAWHWMESEFVRPIAVDAERLFDIQLVTFDNQAYLYLQHHHIYIDGWGRALLVKAIAQNYNAISNNTALPKGSSFSKYLETKTTEASEETLHFWKTQFDVSFERSAFFEPIHTTTTSLPSERFISKWSSPAFHKKYASKGRFYVQLAALCTTFCRMLGKDEITVGIPLLNRHNEEELETIGYFVGVMPLRIQIPEDITFKELVSHIQTLVKKTRPYRNISVQEINREIGIHQTDFHQAYDIVFSFEPHSHTYEFGTIQAIEAGTFSSNFEQNPLVIHAQQFTESDSVDFVWDYNLKYLDSNSVQKMAKRYLRVLDTIPNQMHTKLSELPVLSDSEKERLLSFSKGISIPRDHETIRSWMLQTTAARKHQNALVDGDKRWTYEKLIKQARNLAIGIQQKQLFKGHHVGISLPRSGEVIVAIAACVLAEVPYTYLDPHLGEERKQHMIHDAAITLSIGTAPLSDSIENILPDQHFSGSLNALQTKANDPIYALFTSGSTGTPKGVSIPHKGIVNLIQELETSFFKTTHSDPQLALLSPFSFDASVQFVFSCLCLGYPLHIVPETIRKDGRELAQFYVKNAITHSDGIPSDLTALHLRNKVLPKQWKVSHFLIGGEAMHLERVQDFVNWYQSQNQANEIYITNAYGPTECSVDTTLFHFTPRDLQTFDRIPIGRPISNVQTYILDPRGTPVPIGTKGVLYVGGDGLALTYLNAPELTAAAFVQHPTFGRLYKTGDLTAWKEDGSIHCYGRSDHQVKIRGFRIELEEIEKTLQQLVSIQEVCVVVHTKGNNKMLIAYLVTDASYNEIETRAILAESLPEYMIPHVFVPLESLPKTRSGKTDRNALRTNAIQAPTTEIVQPETSTEKTVAVIVSGILDLEWPDINASFFSLGGDSLSLVYLMTELEEVFQMELPIHLIADRNSIREIGAFLDHRIEMDAPTIDLQHELQQWNFPSTHPKPSTTSVALITGATGFVGAFLLNEILDRYEKVYCLIRSKSELHAHLRLKTVAVNYELDMDPADARIHYLFGDLDKPQLGMNTEKWELLSKEVKDIYHSGAEVHFMKNVASMRDANIGGTAELLRLSCTDTLKNFHFISTVGIFTEEHIHISEHHPIDQQLHAENNGYQATKWMAENLVLRAKSKGIPCSIYRLARVTGHSKLGAANFNDFFHRFLLGSLDLGIFPEILMDRDTDLTPIDTAVQSIVSLATSAQLGIYHIINPNRMRYTNLLKQLRKEGTPLKIVSTNDYIEQALASSQSPDHPLYTIMPILKQKSWFSVNSYRFDMSNTLLKLKEHGISWPLATDLQKTYTKRLLIQKQRFGNNANIKTH